MFDWQFLLCTSYLKIKIKNTNKLTQPLVTYFGRLFDDAANKLNLHSLMGFMSELCFCSHKELITILPRNKGTSTRSKKSAQIMPDLSVHSRLLYPRLVDVMLKCVRSGRPMIHLVMAWAIVGPHLMEVRDTFVEFFTLCPQSSQFSLFLQSSSLLSKATGLHEMHLGWPCAAQLRVRAERKETTNWFVYENNSMPLHSTLLLLGCFEWRFVHVNPGTATQTLRASSNNPL